MTCPTTLLSKSQDFRKLAQDSLVAQEWPGGVPITLKRDKRGPLSLHLVAELLLVTRPALVPVILGDTAW